MAKPAADERTPNPIDIHVGGRIRVRRRIINVSQEKLADALGLTFQQVQKYERGANRVSASKLYEIARTLSVPIIYFFEGLPEPETGALMGIENEANQFLATAEGIELARLFPRINRARLRRRILDLVRDMTLTQDDETSE